ADTNNDQLGEVIFGTWDCNLYCIEFPVQEMKPNSWYCLRGSNFNTGYHDSDDDLLDDFTERYYNTSIDNYDTDGDLYSDWLEVFAGTNPTNPKHYPNYDPPFIALPEKRNHTLFINQSKLILLPSFLLILIIQNLKSKKSKIIY
ncbi:MAG: thrombospondin type 3 repeat-containing protein, partial [Candidatus Thorarchaeota archaeon]